MKLIEKIYSKRLNEEVVTKYELFKSSAAWSAKGLGSVYIPADLSCLCWLGSNKTNQWGVPEEQLGGRRTVTYFLEEA